AYIFAVTLIKPEWAPALPKEARTLGDGVTSLLVMIAIGTGLYFLGYHILFTGIASAEWQLVAALAFGVISVYVFALVNRGMNLNVISRLAQQVIIVMVPPLALIFLVLGTIFLGIATPTEGGAMGATGALIIATAKGRMNLSILKNALDATTRLSAFVMMILIGARVFGLTFYGINGNVWIEDLMLALPGGEYGFLVAVTIIIFILGCFLDFFEIAFIMVPLLVPVAQSHGIDLVWFGIILGINLQTSFLTPPFGFSLFYLRSVAPEGRWKDKVTGQMREGIKTMDIYKGVLPFIIIQFLAIVIVIAFPGLVMHYKGTPVVSDPSTIQIELPGFGAPTTPSFGQPGTGGGATPAPSFGLPPPNFGSGQPSAPAPAGSAPAAPAPSLGLPPPDFGGTPAPAAPPATPAPPDLSQPPAFN
ncbi:MAG: TRAP transporter large permease subunit, partial [Rhizobium rhizophilum]